VLIIIEISKEKIHDNVCLIGRYFLAGERKYKFTVTHHYQNNQKYIFSNESRKRELVDPIKVREEFMGEQKEDKYENSYFHVDSPIFMEDDMRDLYKISDKE